METPFSIIVIDLLSLGVLDRGNLSLVKITLGPTKTSLLITTASKILAPFLTVTLL